MNGRIRAMGTRALRSRAAHLVTAAVAVSALLALCLLASATPSTSSGYIAKLNNSANSVATASRTCVNAAAIDRTAGAAYFQYALNDSPLGIGIFGTSPDASGSGNTGLYRSVLNTYSNTTPIACSRDGGSALNFNGVGTYLSSTNTVASPANYTISVWFKATAVGGKLIGLGNAATGASGSYDRHLYIDSTGKLVFGSYTTTTQTISSPASVVDSAWHLAVGTQSSATGGGMTLYLDGVQVAQNTTFTGSQAFTGYWRIGYDNLSGWPNAPTNQFFTGQMRYVAAYGYVLTAAQIKNDYLAGS